MCVHPIFLNLFVIWLSAVVLALVTHYLYFDGPGSEFFQALLLGILLASSVLYMALRALERGQSVIAIVGVGCLLAAYAFDPFSVSMDLRQVILILLGISVVFNLALGAAIQKKAFN